MHHDHYYHYQSYSPLEKYEKAKNKQERNVSISRVTYTPTITTRPYPPLPSSQIVHAVVRE